MATFPTIDEIKLTLGIDPNDVTYDEAIASNLAATISLIESYLGRGIAYADELQEFDPPDTENPALLLYRFPVDVVNEVTVEGQALGGWRVQKRSGIVRWHEACACTVAHYCCRSAPQIVVDYTGGYPDDAWPADLLDAVMQVFYGRWRASNNTGNIAEIPSGGGVRSVSVDGLTVQYDSATFAGSAFAGSVVPPELTGVAAALDPYRARLLTGV